jgi:5-formyltetrahydrofolate cyclo-ligase
VTLPPEPDLQPGDPGADKRDLRARLRAARRDRDDTARYAAASGLAVRIAAVPEVAALVAGGGGCLAAYASLPDEPGTDALRALLALSGVQVLLPVIREDGDLDWGWDADDLAPRAHGLAVREPAVADLPTGADGLAAGRCRVLLVPALAVDVRGYRLGQGGGFYDRLLAGVPAAEVGGPLRVAVVHDDEVLEQVPNEPHDRRMDAVLTPSAYRRVR